MAHTRRALYALAALSAAATFGITTGVTTGVTSANAQPLPAGSSVSVGSPVTTGPTGVAGPSTDGSLPTGGLRPGTDPTGGPNGPACALLPNGCRLTHRICPPSTTSLRPPVPTFEAPRSAERGLPSECQGKRHGHMTGKPHHDPVTTPDPGQSQPAATPIQPERAEPDFTG